MGKRSAFERLPRDFYPTPAAAVPPLIPHLRGVRSFAEPCAGDGSLVRHLEAHGLRCAYAGDIADGRDALAVADMGAPDAIITNPPYERSLMHALIQHLQQIAPTWLLLEMDWAATKQAVPYLTSCSHIVSIARLKWIEGSKHTGKDNHAWFKFDARHGVGPIFHPQGASPTTPGSRCCTQCAMLYRPQRSDSKFCSDACRQRAHRERLSVTQP